MNRLGFFIACVLAIAYLSVCIYIDHRAEPNANTATQPVVKP